MAFDIRNPLWMVCFSTKHRWFEDVSTYVQNDLPVQYRDKVFPSLLLNPDKSLKAFGYEAEQQFISRKEERSEDYYYFRRFTTDFFSNQVSSIFLEFQPFGI